MRKLGWLDYILYAFVGAIGVFIMYTIKSLMDTRNMALFSVTSPLIFPFLIGIALLVFIALTFISDLRGVKKSEDEDEENDGERLSLDVGMAVLYAVGVIAYTYVIRRVSFVPGSIAFLVIAMAIMNYEEQKIGLRIGKATIVSLVAVPVLYYVFHSIFNVMLP